MIYNTLQSVVALVEADSAAEAEAKLYDALKDAGFECYAAESNGAFVSEDQDDGADLIHNVR